MRSQIHNQTKSTQPNIMKLSSSSLALLLACSSSCEASGLRTKRTEENDRRLNTAYDTTMDMLATSYDGNCSEPEYLGITTLYPPFKVECSNQDSTAVLHATGGVDNVPTSLQICNTSESFCANVKFPSDQEAKSDALDNIKSKVSYYLNLIKADGVVDMPDTESLSMDQLLAKLLPDVPCRNMSFGSQTSAYICSSGRLTAVYAVQGGVTGSEESLTICKTIIVENNGEYGSDDECQAFDVSGDNLADEIEAFVGDY